MRQVAATPFEIAIPGHGAPMSHAEFQHYRAAFEAFVACSSSTRAADDCASAWTNSVGSLLGKDAHDPERARKMTAYYVGMLRANGGRSKYCGSVQDH